jgi:phage gp36-like protein
MATRFGNSGRGERTPNQPPQGEGVTGAIINYGREKIKKLLRLLRSPKRLDERGAGAINDESGQTEAELMNRELSPVWLTLREQREELRNYLIKIAQEYLQPTNIKRPYRESFKKELKYLESFSGTAVLRKNTKGTEVTELTEGLETMIKTAFEYIRRLGINDNSEINDNSNSLLATLVAKTVYELNITARKINRAVYKIADTQFSYETKAVVLNKFISFMVDLISNIDPEFRGRNPRIIENYFDSINGTLLAGLEGAAYALVDEAAKAGYQELINAISELLKMTKELRSDELAPIYAKILVQIFVMIRGSVMENGNIDDNLIKQVTNWYINYFPFGDKGITNQINQYVRKLLSLTESDLEFLETLTQRLDDLAYKTGNNYYRSLANYLNKCFSNPNKELEGKNATFVELRRNNTGLERNVQIPLKQNRKSN